LVIERVSIFRAPFRHLKSRWCVAASFVSKVQLRFHIAKSTLQRYVVVEQKNSRLKVNSVAAMHERSYASGWSVFIACAREARAFSARSDT